MWLNDLIGNGSTWSGKLWLKGDKRMMRALRVPTSFMAGTIYECLRQRCPRGLDWWLEEITHKLRDVFFIPSSQNHSLSTYGMVSNPRRHVRCLRHLRREASRLRLRWQLLALCHHATRRISEPSVVSAFCFDVVAGVSFWGLCEVWLKRLVKKVFNTVVIHNRS